jgi:hypothetical protein
MQRMSFILFFVLIIMVFACNDNSISSIKEIEFPEENVSFQQHVEPFMKLTCAYGSCHDVSGFNGDDLSTYFAMMSSTGLIIPGKPESSHLIQILEDPLRHPIIFYSYDINQNHIDGMKKWIEEGAEFN